MNKQMFTILMFCVGIATTLAACGGSNAPSQAAPTSASSGANPTQIVSTSAPSETAVPSGSQQPTTSGSNGATGTQLAAVSGLPDWWPQDLQLPVGTKLEPVSGMWL